MTESTVGRRERKKEETKQKIFLTAVKLFSEKGFEATTVDEIAEAADVSKGTLFNYFPKKETLVEYLAEENLEVIEEAAHASKASAVERIRAVYDALAASYEENPDLTRTLMKTASSRLCCPVKGGPWQQFRDLVVEIIKEGQARGEFRKHQDPIAVHGTLVSCFVGSVMWWLGERAESDDPKLKALTLLETVRTLQGNALEGIRS